jgi:CcmD family protein
MLYLCMAFSVLLIMLFGYVFYLDRQIAALNKKIQTRTDPATRNTPPQS